MSSLEERARAAVRATAAEIGPQDVPPMRLLGSGADGGQGPVRGGWGSRGAGRRAAWQWGVPLAAAAAVVAVIVGAGLLGGVSPLTGSHPASQPAAKPSKTASPVVAARAYPPNLKAGLTGFFLPASGAQYSAGALFNGEYRALEGQISSKCMVRLGFPAQPTGSPADLARGIWDLTQFPDLTAIAKAGTLPSYSVAAGPQESKAYQRAAMKCAKAGYAVFTPMINAGTALESAWLTIVDSIQSSAAVNATLPELRDCAARYGWPSQPYGAPDSTINSFSDFVGWVAGHIDGAGSRGATSAQLNALNRHWGTVFVQCARPTVALMERLQLAAQANYLAEHHREFDALVRTARADFARAERLAGK